MSVYFIVLDFESNTPNQGEDGHAKDYEIIEFPSVIVKWDEETKKCVEVDRFQSFCKPTRKISQFIQELTTIQQADVDASPTFVHVMNNYMEWLSRQPFFNDEKIHFVTCGDWDLRKMLPMQCEKSGIEVPTIMKSWINIKKVLAKVTKKKVIGMSQTLSDLGIELTGTHHRGIDDCVNIAKILRHLLEKENWKVEIDMEQQQHQTIIAERKVAARNFDKKEKEIAEINQQRIHEENKPHLAVPVSDFVNFLKTKFTKDNRMFLRFPTYMFPSLTHEELWHEYRQDRREGKVPKGYDFDYWLCKLPPRRPLSHFFAEKDVALFEALLKEVAGSSITTMIAKDKSEEQLHSLHEASAFMMYDKRESKWCLFLESGTMYDVGRREVSWELFTYFRVQFI
jgi:inhibitor of KinA sporulation pathway (predicted exonuclease)